MSQNLTQPEEIDQILMNMENSTADTPDQKTSNETEQKGWSTGYVSPYRAAHMKSYRFTGH
ncbi:MAG: hypothetical protein WC216_07865 [Gallionella sp.]|jgi:hypothetical protein